MVLGRTDPVMGNQRYQAHPLRYFNQANEVYHLFIERKVLGDMKYLMRSVKQGKETVGILTEENCDVKIVNSLYTMVYGRINFKRNNRFDSLRWS